MGSVIRMLLTGGLLIPPVCAAIASSPVIQRITVTGHRVLSSGEILDAAGIRQGAVYDSLELERGLDRLLERYAQLGHLWAEVLPPSLRFSSDSTSVDLAIEVREGPPARIDRIEVTGNRMWTADALLNQFDTRAGGAFDATTLERDIERLLTRYETEGHPYCRIDITDIQADEGRLTIRLSIDEGPLVRIAGFHVTGNTVTSPHVITREFRIAPGDPFDQRRLTRGRERLQRLGIFERVSEPELEMAPSGEGGIIVLEVEEGRSSAIDGLIGYTPGVGGRSGFVTGALTLSLLNVAGTGRRVNAAWTRRDPLSSDIEIRYEEPWVLGSPLTAGVDLSQVAQDSSYTATQIGLRVGLPLSDHFQGHVRIGWRRVIPDSISAVLLARSREVSGALGVTADTRDRAWNPRRGFLYGVDIRFGLRTNDAGAFFTPERSRVRTGATRVDLEHYLPLFRNHVVAVMLHGVDIRSGERALPLSDQFRFGGTRTLRGYRENEFHGSQAAWSNLEYRILMSSRSRFFAFFDAGYFSFNRVVNGGVERVSAAKTGFGLGLRIESALGVIGLDYGVGEDDTLLNGKLHIGLRNEF